MHFAGVVSGPTRWLIEIGLGIVAQHPAVVAGLILTRHEIDIAPIKGRTVISFCVQAIYMAGIKSGIACPFFEWSLSVVTQHNPMRSTVLVVLGREIHVASVKYRSEVSGTPQPIGGAGIKRLPAIHPAARRPL